MAERRGFGEFRRFTYHEKTGLSAFRAGFPINAQSALEAPEMFSGAEISSLSRCGVRTSPPFHFVVLTYTSFPPIPGAAHGLTAFSINGAAVLNTFTRINLKIHVHRYNDYWLPAAAPNPRPDNLARRFSNSAMMFSLDQHRLRSGNPEAGIMYPGRASRP
jgi:hypothetical protein